MANETGRRKNLKMFRVEHDMTQNDMSDALGCTRDGYSRVENGKCDPSVKFFQNLQDHFSVPNEKMWDLVVREKNEK